MDPAPPRRPVVAAVDQEEAVEAEQVARDRLAMYDAMFQALPAQIALFSPSARYEYVSPSAIRNDALRQWIIGRTDREYAAYRNRPLALAERREQAIFAVLASGEPQEFDETLEAPDGSIRHFRRFDVPIFDAQGAVTRVLGYGIDVTAQREVERQLQQAQKMDALGRLAGGVAHDFNNLLTVIGGCSEALQEELPTDDPRRALVEPIIEAGQRAAELTRQLLAFSRRSVGTLQAVDLGALVDQTVGMLRRLIGEGITIHVEPPAEPLHIRMDASQLQQVLMNLAVNARDAMPDGGTLALVMRRTDVVRPDIDLGSQYHAELEVRDTGHGMSDDIRRQVFEPFFTTKPVGQGTGLGLSTAYGIISNAGGTIAVESGEGTGTTFRILLPLAESEGITSEVSPRHDAPRGVGTILVVDDATLVRGLVQRQLIKLGYTVLTASDGVHALEVAGAHVGPIDLLVSDVVMPRMGGPALAKALRMSRPDVPVLFMSGYANDASLLQVMEEIGSSFLQKPFAITALAERVAAMLRSD